MKKQENRSEQQQQQQQENILKYSFLQVKNLTISHVNGFCSL